MNPELQRIRLLENRMRKKTKTTVQKQNQQSIKSIKSTDSKRVPQVIFKEGKFQQIGKQLVEAEPQSEQSNQRILTQEEVKRNKKITDYFTFKPMLPKPSINEDENHLTQSMKAQIVRIQKEGVLNKSVSKGHYEVKLQEQASQENSKCGRSVNIYENSIAREQSFELKEKLKKTQKDLEGCKRQLLQYVIKYHKMKRTQLRHKVSNNKIRIGQLMPDKRGKQIWVDGTEIRQIKQKIQAINKEKEQLQKLKKQSKKSNKQYQEDPQEWKNSIAAQSYFLGRQENHYMDILRRLEEEKAVHIRQLKLLYDQEHSKYGRVDPTTGTSNWKRIEQYQLLSLLGKGGFSEVYLAFDVVQMRQAACKIHEFLSSWSDNSKSNYIKHALRENNVHKTLSHPNIVKLYEAVEIDQNSFCTVLEYCQGPDLSYHLKKHKKVPEKQAKMIIKQVINAIRYLHSLPEKVIHYDLKPMNILFHKGKVKITDFGLCKVAKENMIELTSQGVGTYWYLPPECFETDKKAVITPKVDIWSIGVVYYQMLYGEKPFGQKMSQQRVLNEGIILKATSVNFPINPKNSVSNQSKEFIKACLKANVEQRMDIYAASTHKLFEKK